MTLLIRSERIKTRPLIHQIRMKWHRGALDFTTPYHRYTYTRTINPLTNSTVAAPVPGNTVRMKFATYSMQS